jgi:ribosomal protein S18 acetylase RimI-like enzyme
MIRSLDGIGWDELAEAFTEAFSDYAVAMRMTPAALATMQVRRGFVAASSFGAWDGSRLVGFVLTCRDGARVYNSGTGVVPGHRRGGLARELVERVIASARGAAYVLEVLEDNVKAIALYQAAGFVETRRFQSWAYAGEARPAAIAVDPDLDGFAAEAEVEPSWQNSIASIRRAPEPPIVLGDERGIAVVFAANGDVPLLVVRRDARRRGHGRNLLAAAANAAGKPLRILNLDDRATEIAAFLEAAGATRTVRQLEMLRR